MLKNASEAFLFKTTLKMLLSVGSILSGDVMCTILEQSVFFLFYRKSPLKLLIAL